MSENLINRIYEFQEKLSLISKDISKKEEDIARITIENLEIYENFFDLFKEAKQRFVELIGKDSKYKISIKDNPEIKELIESLSPYINSTKKPIVQKQKKLTDSHKEEKISLKKQEIDEENDKPLENSNEMSIYSWRYFQKFFVKQR